MTTKASCGCVVEDFEDLVNYSRRSWDEYGQRCVEYVSNCKRCHEMDIEDGDILETEEQEIEWMAAQDAVTYSTNWMGPINSDWYRNRGLTEPKEFVVKDQAMADIKGLEVGDKFYVDEVTTYYSAGRIDIRDERFEGYAGWGEYSVAPMHGEDWNALSDFLWDLATPEVLPKEELFRQFEEHYGKKIRWAHDRWCEECFMEGFHKMGCSVNYEKYKVDQFESSARLEE